MAKNKSLKDELAKLAGGKKPNVFYKGLNLDTDENVIANDQYLDALNVRLNNKDTDFGTLQNLQSTIDAGSFGLSGWKFRVDGTLPIDSNYPDGPSFLWFLPGGYDYADAGINGIKFIWKDNSGGTILTKTVSTTEADWTSGIPYNATAVFNSNRDMILHCYEVLRNDTTVTDVFNVVLEIQNDYKFQAPNLYFFIKDTSLVAGTIEIYWVKTNGAESQVVSTFSNGALKTWDATVYAAGGFSLFPVAIVSFSDYIAAICYNTVLKNVVVKVKTNESGSVTSIEPVIISDFGITNNYSSIKAEKIEENENFNRIYWTDGINPVKTVNLEATAGFYRDFVNADDFNLFAKSPLTPIKIIRVNEGGAVNCGSWSYCYRLVTKDGKFSVVSPITNPINLTKGSLNLDYHLTEGGNVSENSGKSITMKVENISKIYNKIQLVGIQYIDNLGGAYYLLLKEEAIESDSIILNHNGNENHTVLTAGDVLISRNTWDIAQTIAVKDNRLLAANLRNTASDIIDDPNAFRVKSYKHSVGATAWDTAPASGAYSTYDGLNNPDLYDESLYKHTHTNTTKYRYAEGVPDGSGDSHTANNSKLVFGASTPGFHNSGDINGVYISFSLTSINLNKVEYWETNGGTNFGGGGSPTSYGSFNEGHHQAPYYGPKSKQKIFVDNAMIGDWFNYKGPHVTHQRVGYMRDEIYRFGIQFFDKSGNQTFTYPIGDIRMPPIESDYRYLGPLTDNSYEPISGGTNSTPTKHLLMDAEGNGWVLSLRVSVKLKQDVKNKISGFNIVRGERTDSDKRVITAGLLNQTLFMNPGSANGDIANSVALDKVALFTQKTGDSDFGNAVSNSEFYTLDSPEVMFGRLQYTATGTHKIKIAHRLIAKSWNKTARPSYIATTTDGDSNVVSFNSSNDNVFDDNNGGTHQVNWYKDDVHDYYYACPVYPDYTVAPDLGDTRKLSLYTIYMSDENVSSELGDAAHVDDQAYTIHYGQKVGPNEMVSASNYDTYHNQNFINASLFYGQSDNFAFIDTAGGTDYIEHDSGRIMHGNTTLFLALPGSRFDTSSTGNCGFGSTLINAGNYDAAKPYAKIINPITATSGIYGGNSESAFEKTRWISTGASVHGNDIIDGVGQETNLYVNGGDTYLNMFSINKFHRAEYNAGKTYTAVQGVVFPIESTINIDMRHGEYFGKMQPNLMKEDDYLYHDTYSASNNTKTFPAKDSNIRLVNNFKNLIAVSNVKIAGQSEDAFSKFDSAEIFEVNHNYGGINNLITFKDQLYALQDNAVSIVSMNTRALIQSEDGSSIAIQSFLGTGTVIERNDYISTVHGSQHRMNGISTDKGLYWWDKYLNTICKVDVKAPNQVIDLLQAKNCTSFMGSYKQFPIHDNPLNVTAGSNNTNKGGFFISHSAYLNELVFGFTYNVTGVNYMNVIAIAYDELLDVFTSKRNYANILSVSHRGYLYSIGFLNNFVDVTSTDVLRKKLYIHDTKPGLLSGSESYNNFYGANSPVASHFTFSYNQDQGDIKVFDKITIKSSVGADDFKAFEFNSDLDNDVVLSLLSDDISSGMLNKKIVPIFAGEGNGRVEGSYLRVKMSHNSNAYTNPFNIFSVTTHSRKVII